MPAADHENRPTSRLAVLALSLALVGAASMLYYHLGLFLPYVTEVNAARDLIGPAAFGNDFYQVWLTARECVHSRRNPYSDEMTREIQMGLFGRSLDPRRPGDPVDRRVFPYPAYVDLLFWPASLIPFDVLRVGLAALLVAVAVCTPLLWLRALAWRISWNWLAVIVLLTLCSYPVLEGLYAEQIGLIVAFLLAVSIVVLQRGSLLAAGILMALTTIKPQATALVIVYLAIWSAHDWSRCKRFCVGLFSAMAVLAGAALIVWPHWIQSWTRTVLAYRGYTRPPLVTEVLTSLLGQRAGALFGLLGIIGLLTVAGVLIWRHQAAAAGSNEFHFTLSLLLAITAIALLPGQAVYDHVMLLPGILLMARGWRGRCTNWTTKLLLGAGLATLLWPWFAAFGVIATHPLWAGPHADLFLSLPLRTAASFPFVVAALLALTGRRLAVEPQLR